jgi:uncharacterized protein
VGANAAGDVITLDTSAVLALVNVADTNHTAAIQRIDAAAAPCVVPMAIMAEVGYMIERWISQERLAQFLERVSEGALDMRCGDGDLPRIGELVRRYADLPLGFSDAAVVACAEASGGQVLTFDQRDFTVVAAEGTILLL